MSEQRYNHLAPVYRALEYALLGHSLERARERHLDALAKAGKVLVVGEGDGRFLEALLSVNPHCAVDCIEQSAGMLRQIRGRIKKLGAVGRVRLVRADARGFAFGEEAYDAVVSHFFFDILEPQEIRMLIPRLAASLRRGGRWMVADFHLPPSGLPRLRSRLWLALLYGFFRWQAGVTARKLVDVTPMIMAQGLGLKRDSYLRRGLLRSQLFVKAGPGAGG